MRVVLAVGAHPDDIELGCSGTLARHKTKGDKVYLLVLTKGEASGNIKLREAECCKSAKMLNADKLFFGKLEDTKVHDGRETIDVIEKVIHKTKPDIIYAPSCKDTHQDHRNAGHATLSAGRRCKLVLQYEGASTQRDFIPQVFVDIRSTFDLKKKILRVFGSQLNGKRGGYALAAKAIEGLAQFRGYQAGLGVAEAFEVGKFLFEV
ncbi:MAG: PIG-L family deacetylase [Candidatus Bathyarchaeota archaeon]|nr:PIG-L family deacetylase [Candidatus Bathyarchaeota archaeon]